MTNQRKYHNTRIFVGVTVMVIIAAVHAFRLGSYLSGNMYIYYYSFASDIMLPFGAYFLLSMNELSFKFIRKWYVKACIVFGVMTISEIFQYFGIYFFGVTFDWLDILMYGTGAISAALLDRLVLWKFLTGWNYNFNDNLA